jgi:hypothetical protein
MAIDGPVLAARRPDFFTGCLVDDCVARFLLDMVTVDTSFPKNE